MRLVAFSETPLCLIDVLTATMLQMEFFQALKLLSLELRQEFPSQGKTIIVGDPGTKIALAKLDL